MSSEKKKIDNSKKTGRRTSQVCSDLGDGSKRYLVVQSELKSVFQPTVNRQEEIDRFTQESDRQGVMRTVVSLIMNYAYSSWISENSPDIQPLEKSTGFGVL